MIFVLFVLIGEKLKIRHSGVSVLRDRSQGALKVLNTDLSVSPASPTSAEAKTCRAGVNSPVCPQRWEWKEPLGLALSCSVNRQMENAGNACAGSVKAVPPSLPCVDVELAVPAEQSVLLTLNLGSPRGWRHRGCVCVCVDGVFSLLADDLEWVWKLLSLCFGFSCITFSAVCGGLAAPPVFFLWFRWILECFENILGFKQRQVGAEEKKQLRKERLQ